MDLCLLVLGDGESGTMLHLNKIPFPLVKDVTDSGRSLVMVPVGAVKEHGTNLPLGLNTFAAETYAEEAARHLEEGQPTLDRTTFTGPWA